ncbi:MULTISPECIES: TetR/AcrR family transcriptional regulator [unclassified Streptomyces]|uniref:TetR/AcrR family transcriptional regulator n=1 Tax=Streptomyces TaxID=1883 RepID=UPI0001C1A74A|nr:MULTISPECIES: TetR/AcrR family transcriptional regulator [unclassified Streptomyces]AEN13862.1 transcriptional regulator, TetR family [Streptomyces sp. SirexAA-E]MYR67906.1 TetR family transcriptional regulator [Streptomyces sp. SID4939]MYS00268.1 TetR family transcriptional regulator [Streptomyces sp. SID4940]MYT67751.1 TetR family transcriptional regulator [Streptomyces sp. SID8357]MYT86595.1 TetR family transcriptional regulator [Streptomyces sp. SID8360]
MSSPGSAQESAPASRRSKITPERAQELYTAVLDLLRESGYDSLTMEGVAARTRCGKSTLYRQWGSKPELVVAALHATSRTLPSTIDTGSLRGDLYAVAATFDDTDRDTALMHALTHAALQSPELLCALRETLIAPSIAAIDTMVKRAIERGEIAADNPAAPYVAAQLLGIMRARPLLPGRYAGEGFLVRFIECAVLPALGLPAPPPGP